MLWAPALMSCSSYPSQKLPHRGRGVGHRSNLLRTLRPGQRSRQRGGSGKRTKLLAMQSGEAMSSSEGVKHSQDGLYVADAGTFFVPTEDMWLIHENSM